MTITAIQPTQRPVTKISPDTPATPTPGQPAAQAPYDDRFEMTPQLRLAGFKRSLRLSRTELFGGHKIDEAQVHFEKGWQRLLHRVFPGGAFESAFARPEPAPAAEAIPNGPNVRHLDARTWMPNVRFERGEDMFPCDPTFDGDSDVTNNREHYRPGSIDGNQAPTYYVHARQKGEYTVLQYWAYHAQNKFINTHKHDFEMFAVYLKPDAKGRLQPAYLQTDWHGTVTMTPWSQLQLDSAGRPTVLTDLGSHEIRPLRLQDQLPAGSTLMPQGIWQDEQGRRPVTLHLKGDEPQVSGLEPVRPIKPGLDPRDAWYPGGNWIFGFRYDNRAVGGGPRNREYWNNPPHPAAFGFETAATGNVVPLAAARR